MPRAPPLPSSSILSPESCDYWDQVRGEGRSCHDDCDCTGLHAYSLRSIHFAVFQVTVSQEVSSPKLCIYSLSQFLTSHSVGRPLLKALNVSILCCSVLRKGLLRLSSRQKQKQLCRNISMYVPNYTLSQAGSPLIQRCKVTSVKH
jgi:hypothetical protein